MNFKNQPVQRDKDKTLGSNPYSKAIVMKLHVKNRRVK